LRAASIENLIAASQTVSTVEPCLRVSAAHAAQSSICEAAIDGPDLQEMSSESVSVRTVRNKFPKIRDGASRAIHTARSILVRKQFLALFVPLYFDNKKQALRRAL
jgi:hypothetical protein